MLRGGLCSVFILFGDVGSKGKCSMSFDCVDRALTGRIMGYRWYVIVLMQFYQQQ